MFSISSSSKFPGFAIFSGFMLMGSSCSSPLISRSISETSKSSLSVSLLATGFCSICILFSPFVLNSCQSLCTSFLSCFTLSMCSFRRIESHLLVLFCISDISVLCSSVKSRISNSFSSAKLLRISFTSALWYSIS